MLARSKNIRSNSKYITWLIHSNKPNILQYSMGKNYLYTQPNVCWFIIFSTEWLILKNFTWL